MAALFASGCAAGIDDGSASPADVPEEQATKSVEAPVDGPEGIPNPVAPLDEYRGGDEPMVATKCIRNDEVTVVWTKVKPDAPSADQKRAALDAVRAYYFGEHDSHTAVFLRCPE